MELICLGKVVACANSIRHGGVHAHGMTLVVPGAVRPQRAGCSEDLEFLAAVESEIDRDLGGYTAGELHDVLFEGEPRLQTMASGDGNSFAVRVSNITEDQVPIAAERLYEVLRDAPGPKNVRHAAPAADLTGRWDAELTFLRGSSSHEFYLQADGNRLAGTHHGRNSQADLSGFIDGDQVEFASNMRSQGALIYFTFSGTLRGNEMSGEVDLGEYGSATWRAKRYESG